MEFVERIFLSYILERAEALEAHGGVVDFSFVAPVKKRSKTAVDKACHDVHPLLDSLDV